MESILVSFCIAAFQRHEILRELLLEILSVRSEKFEVIVCDDCSKDNSVEKLKEEIKDTRLKIYENNINVGSLPNIYEALNHGVGKYLFYINDRDNIDPFKIKKLIDLINELEEKDVAFIKCINLYHAENSYQIFESEEESILEFACRIDHPTGYIFRKDVWDKIKCRKKLFYKQCYGDYPISMICAIMARKYKGAKIFGDVCDVSRNRIDFTQVKSGYYWKRKDKSVWYSPWVQWRELMIAYTFLKKINIEEQVIDKLLCIRFGEYLQRVTIEYKDILSNPSNTIHYNLNVPKSFISIHMAAIKNGLYLWKKMFHFCKYYCKKDLLISINKYAKNNYKMYFRFLYKSIFRELEERRIAK